jgi:preprotein translocase subunit SecE
MDQVTKAPAAPVRWLGEAADFLRSVRGEMAKVTWPTREELTKATRMILVLAVALGLAIGWMDLLFNMILVNGVARLSR